MEAKERTMKIDAPVAENEQTQGQTPQLNNLNKEAMVTINLNTTNRNVLTSNIENWVREICLSNGSLLHSPYVVDLCDHLIDIDEAVWQMFTLHDCIFATEYGIDVNVCKLYIDSDCMTVVVYISVQPHIDTLYPRLGFFVKVVIEKDGCDDDGDNDSYDED